MSTEELYKLFRANPTVCTDSRNAIQGSVFFALKGENFDGNKFAESALRNGCAYAVVDNPKARTSDKTILVEDSLTALQSIAAIHRTNFNIPVIAITGTNGKTTTKELITNVLSQKFNVLSTSGNLNNHIGVPLTLLRLSEEYDIAVIEMGANHVGEIAILCRLSKPTHGLITNIGKAHLEGFGGVQGVVKAKKELYDYLVSTKGRVYVNCDNELLTLLLNGYETVNYGPSENCRYSGVALNQTPFLELQFNEKDGNKLISENIQTRLIGEYNLENVLAAAAVGRSFNIPVLKIKQAIENYIPQNNRSQKIKTKKNTLILDAYNANPTSMEAALINFRNIDAENKMVILGEMAELGNEAPMEHERIIKLLKQYNFSECYLVGESFYSLKSSVAFNVFRTTHDLMLWLEQNPPVDKHILVKGSRVNYLEQIVDIL